VKGTQPMTQSLDFGTVAPSENVRSFATEYPHYRLANTVLLSGMLALIVFCAWIVCLKSNNNQSPLSQVRLNQLPISVKATITLALISYGLVHIFSILTVYLKTNTMYTSAQDYFHEMPTHKLAALSHAHFFGHATMYVLVAALFLFTGLPERLKRIVVVLAPLGAILDNLSWWGMKMASPSFEIVSYFSGSIMIIGFSVMAIVSFFQIWSKNNELTD
jgi:4-amino-4-deoxy-L-arabinose transferase-like glycosyltransferase